MGLKFFDFFAGIGGFRLGMEQAGHECVGHCEIDKYANMSYNAMHKPKKGEAYFEDIRTINDSNMPEADVYCFGFPCQSFSIAGKRRGFNDIRGTLFFEVMRLAAVRKPKILFAENVAGLLSHDHGRTFAIIINTMAELGYFVEWQIINSKYYVPQNRKRVFIIGRFRESCGGQIFPIITGRGKVDRQQRYGDILKEITKGKPQGQRVYDPSGLSVTLGSQGGGQGAKTGLYAVKQCLTPGRENKRQNGRRFKEDGEESFALNTQDRHGVLLDNGEEIRIRKLTPKECFRLQGFPDEYFERAAAVCSENQLYKQAGNSVTVNVIYEIAKRLKV